VSGIVDDVDLLSDRRLKIEEVLTVLEGFEDGKSHPGQTGF
jgi:hypothetical protein